MKTYTFVSAIYVFLMQHYFKNKRFTTCSTHHPRRWRKILALAACVHHACLRSLAIVITNFQSFGPGGLRAPCVAWPLFSPTFALCLFLRLLLLTHFGESPMCKIIFVFKQKKVFFRPFFCFLSPAFGHGRLGHPQSLEYFCIYYS